MLDIDVAAIGLKRVLKEAAGDGPRLDQDDLDAGRRQLHAERVGERLDGEFGGAIGAAIRRCDQAQHRGAEHDPALSLRPHRRDDAAREVVPAEDIGLELGAEHVGPQVLDRAGLTIGAIVEERREPPCRCLEHMRGGFGNRGGLGVVEIKALDGDLVSQPGYVLRFSRGGKHAPAARLHLTRGSQADARRAAGDEDRALAQELVLVLTAFGRHRLLLDAL
jgi:hypothetical protein